MAKKVPFSWESLDERTYRAKVLGGWMVVTEMISNKGNIAATSIFVADTDHQWIPVKLAAVVEKAAIDPMPELLKEKKK